MIERVFTNAVESGLMDDVIVATDDRRIFDCVRSFGGKVTITKMHHRSGTERCAEVANFLSSDTIVINIQGDEPCLDNAHLKTLIDLLKSDESVNIGSLAVPFTSLDAIRNPNKVKVVLDQNGRAIYFSRSPIPFHQSDLKFEDINYYKHIGLYGYRVKTLLEIANLAPTPLEQAESLEQLRWLEHGHSIAIGLTEGASLSVDTPEDIEQLRSLFVN